jgi:hypothetical protein
LYRRSQHGPVTRLLTGCCQGRSYLFSSSLKRNTTGARRIRLCF